MSSAWSFASPSTSRGSRAAVLAWWAEGRRCSSEEVSSRSLLGARIQAVASAPASALFEFAQVVGAYARGEYAELHSAAARRPLIRARRRSPAGARGEPRNELKASSRTGARECSALISTRGLGPASLLRAQLRCVVVAVGRCVAVGTGPPTSKRSNREAPCSQRGQRVTRRSAIRRATAPSAPGCLRPGAGLGVEIGELERAENPERHAANPAVSAS